MYLLLSTVSVLLRDSAGYLADRCCLGIAAINLDALLPSSRGKPISSDRPLKQEFQLQLIHPDQNKNRRLKRKESTLTLSCRSVSVSDVPEHSEHRQVEHHHSHDDTQDMEEPDE